MIIEDIILTFMITIGLALFGMIIMWNLYKWFVLNKQKEGNCK